MAATTHTPGPWEIRPCVETETGIRFLNIEHDGRTVAAVGEWRDRETAEKDAALICASPDLLAVCKRLLIYYEADECRAEAISKLDAARAAIAKTEVA